MKLLLCPKCGDLFALRRELRACECGEVTGRYLSNVAAETNGNGISVAIGGGSLEQAVRIMRGIGEGRQFYPVMCWVRPNEGPSNPHTCVRDG